MQIRWSRVRQPPLFAETIFTRIPPQNCMDQGLDSQPPPWSVENATAPSAGGSPGGETRLGKRLPFRTAIVLLRQGPANYLDQVGVKMAL